MARGPTQRPRVRDRRDPVADAADNAVRASRWVDGPFGPHTCVQGYVWREAFAGDDVCVTPDIRTLAALDNQQAGARRNPARFVYGPNTCQNGYVWREADQSDYVVRQRRDPLADSRGQRGAHLPLGHRPLRTAHLRAGLRVARGLPR